MTPSENRRRFLAWASASAALIAAHPLTALGDAGRPAPRQRGAVPPARILSLELLTSASLAAMKEFYGGSLGLAIVEEKTDRITIAGGTTRLTFLTAAAQDGGSPF
jgi:hypothetical protein